jgi:hypothetical protein
LLWITDIYIVAMQGGIKNTVEQREGPNKNNPAKGVQVLFPSVGGDDGGTLLKIKRSNGQGKTNETTTVGLSEGQ